MFKYFIFIFLYVTVATSQTINFTIKDELGVAVQNCNVLFKEKATNNILEFTKITSGKGVYVVKKNYSSIIIEIQSTTYFGQTVEIENPVKEKEYSFVIVLKQNNVTQLQDVVIIAPQRPYVIKKDTVVFDVSKYKDGSEKKVEDLLKKLPGVEVDKNGGIKYKGKSLETVTLDGDNIFSSNYKLGTKNINIDMVEQIEAIENYTNNRLLKGIESEGKVALNLKIKKGKTDYSGNLENGLGLKNGSKGAFYSNSYLMGISAKVKSFSTLNLNNIGRSDAYFYEKQNIKSLDKKSEDDFRTQKIITDDLFQPSLDPIRFNRNNQFFFSHNSLIKLTSKTNLKTNFNYIDDKIDSEQNINTKNFIENGVFETSDNFSQVKKPKIFTVELELKINTSNSTLLEIFSKQYFEKTKFFSDYTKNNQIGYSNLNETNSFFSINKLVHTWKITSNNALQGNLYYTFDKIPQEFNSVSPIETIQQTSEFRKSTFLINYNLIGKYKKLSYTAQIGANNDKTPYKSKNFLEENNSLFTNTSLFGNSRAKFSFGSFLLIPTVSLKNYKLNLRNSNVSTNDLNSLVFEPAVDLQYSRRKSTITLSYSNTQKPINEENIFTNRVFVNNRTTVLNLPTFDFQKTNSYMLNYFYNDFGKESSINFSSRYEKSNGQYLQDFIIDPNFSILKNIFYSVDNSSFNSSLRLSRFVEKLSMNFILSSNFVETEYPNFINNSDIRKNTNQTFKNSLEIRTGFDSKFNFENVFSHNALTSKSIIINSVNSLQNTFKVKYKINKKSRCSLKSDVFFPNTKDKTNNYNFIDFEYFYTLNQKINFSLVANNLLNLKSFNQSENNDFSSYLSQTNLTPRFFLFNVEYNF